MTLQTKKSGTFLIQHVCTNLLREGLPPQEFKRVRGQKEKMEGLVAQEGERSEVIGGGLMGIMFH